MERLQGRNVKREEHMTEEFKNSHELFDAGYAVPLYDNLENKTRWRYRAESWTTDGPPLLCDVVTLRGIQLSVKKVKKP
jgi:hypothetical protein